ncbi:hypothetical protein ACFX2F_030278 [Malus domestica]
MGFSPSSSSVIKGHFFRRPTSPVFVLKLVLLLWVFCSSQNCAVLTDTDASVLLELKNSVSDPSGLLSGWNGRLSSGHCSWTGSPWPDPTPSSRPTPGSVRISPTSASTRQRNTLC